MQQQIIILYLEDLTFPWLTGQLSAKSGIFESNLHELRTQYGSTGESQAQAGRKNDGWWEQQNKSKRNRKRDSV